MSVNLLIDIRESSYNTQATYSGIQGVFPNPVAKVPSFLPIRGTSKLLALALWDSTAVYSPI
jgi:hypothetical protein